MKSERMLDKRARQRGPRTCGLPGRNHTAGNEQQQQQQKVSDSTRQQQQETASVLDDININTNTCTCLMQRLAGLTESNELDRIENENKLTDWSHVVKRKKNMLSIINEEETPRRSTEDNSKRFVRKPDKRQAREQRGHLKRITRKILDNKFKAAAVTKTSQQQVISSPQQSSARQLASLLALTLLTCFLLATSGTMSSAAAGRAPIMSSAASQLQAVSASGQQQQQRQLDMDKQLQLLKSANVELSRRSQRLQRDTSPAPSSDATAVAAGGQQPGGTMAPTCGYPGSPAHASVTFNTSHVVAGTAASYTCDNGYELLGPPRRLCQANGTWSPVGIPFCVLNVGLGKAAMQSSTAGHGSAQKAVDGSTSPYFQASTCTMTDVEHNPWWYVNLLEPYLVQIVRIDFGTACCANRQKATIAVRVGNNRPDLGNNPLCNRYHGFIEEGKPLFLPCTRPAPGAFVSIHLESPSGSSLSICETFIYTDHALSIEQCPSFRDQPLGSTATYNGKCYLFHNNQALNFDSARKYCESRGGTLVDETSPALQGFLSWELYRRHRNDQLMGQYWLGAVKDARNPQNWKWINGKDVQISFWNSLATQGNCSRFDGSKGWLWSDTDCNMNLNFICQYRPLSCGKPEKPTNSTLITKNIDNGTVIEYQCAPGNLLMGPKSRACLPTGFFSEFAPKCKYLDCQFPAMIPNGDYKLLNGTTSYQSVVNYYCNDGFQIYGKATLTCDVDERWNGPPPRCEPLLCSAPVPPSNGYVTVTSNITVPGTQATYDCRPGYELVGDRLLTCSQSGSWDNSFPYCREKRALTPHTLSHHIGSSTASSMLSASTTTTTAATPTSVTSATNSRQQPAQQQRPQQQSTAKPGAGGAVQFPPGGSTFSSSRIATSSPTLPPPPPSTSSTSLPASLNGLASQFIQNNQPPQIAGSMDNTNSLPTTGGEQQQQNRKASQSNSVSQFVVPPLVMPTPLVPNSIEIGQPASSSQMPPIGSVQSSSQQPPQRPRQQPTTGGSTSGGATSATSAQPTLSSADPSSSTSSTSPTSSSTSPISSSTTSNRQQTSVANKFTFMAAQQPTTLTTGHINYDSTPLATTNSISVHSNAHHQHQPVNSVLGSSSSSTTPAATTTTTTTTTASSTLATAPVHGHHSHHSHSIGGAQNVLASFSPPGRSHNTLASAKYSLDGIIAVAIFGGFIFLGAIITVIVIIIRRKSSHSSSIDAQTISTYDSNGEHNGLYRNYQQAWENLRFATPNSQPKSSGTGGVSLITAHVNGGPSVGMKNFASPNTMALVHHPAHIMHHQQHHLHGHHNLAMNGSTTSSQSSSLGGSGGGGVGTLTGGGGDPLLRGHSHAHSHHHHHHHHQRSRHEMDEEEDDLDSGEQGVLSSDEANYRLGVDQGQIGEGFRDTNELTINADTALVNGGGQSQAAARRRIYSTNSIGRSAAMIDDNRLSTNLSMSDQHHAHQHHHHSHHQHQHHRLSSSAGSSQHQRLVSSSTPSTSTRSSRASPPSDDQSLDQLAYGNSWHPNGGSGGGGGQSGSQQDSSSNNNSAGSGAMIIGGGGGRANMRYN